MTATAICGPQLVYRTPRSAYRGRLLNWFRGHGRDFPWRRNRDPYRVLVAELLLQRTQAAQVRPVYEELVRCYPNAAAMCRARRSTLERLLAPLGRRNRLTDFRAAFKHICKHHEGAIPATRAELLRVPGIGDYIANAVLELAYGKRAPLLDPNVYRVLNRAFRVSAKGLRPRCDPGVWQMLEGLLPPRAHRRFGLALIDLGATVCVARDPHCGKCPLRADCAFFQKRRKTGDQKRFIDVFSGAGGMTQGFVDAGYSPVLAVESDPDAAETYERNFGCHIWRGDARKLRSDQIPDADVVIAGPPCQGFTQLGSIFGGGRNRAQNRLWREIFGVVPRSGAHTFVVENVPQFLRTAEFRELTRLGERRGFNVVAGVLNTADYGVPQRRKRALVIGSLLGVPELPPPTVSEPRTVFEAIGDLPDTPPGDNLHTARLRVTSTSLERYRAIPPGGNRFDLARNAPHLLPPCWRRKTTGTTDVFGRLWWDRPFVTIRTEFYKPEKGRYLHPCAPRAITHREAARLQGFNDDFEWCGSLTSIARQIGNAVPPPLAASLAGRL